MSGQTAAQRRAEWLIGVRDGVFTVEDFLDEALRSGDRALKDTALRLLLTQESGVGDAAAMRLIRRLLEVLQVKDQEPKDLTCGFLLHSQAPQRLATFLELRAAGSGPPWPGFPFSPCPRAA